MRCYPIDFLVFCADVMYEAPCILAVTGELPAEEPGSGLSRLATFCFINTAESESSKT